MATRKTKDNLQERVENLETALRNVLDALPKVIRREPGTSLIVNARKLLSE